MGQDAHIPADALFEIDRTMRPGDVRLGPRGYVFHCVSCACMSIADSDSRFEVVFTVPPVVFDQKTGIIHELFESFAEYEAFEEHRRRQSRKVRALPREAFDKLEVGGKGPLGTIVKINDDGTFDVAVSMPSGGE